MAVKYSVNGKRVKKMEFVSELEWQVLLAETARKAEAREKNLARRKRKKSK